METTDNSNTCDHKWVNSGLWDGKSPDGKRTGGQLYKCNVCGDMVHSMEEIKEKGGSYEGEGTDIYGKPINKD